MSETIRKLASVQRVAELEAIAGADKIELAIINGWQVVVKKGEFKVGDLAVYFEIDSWVPTPVAPFLTKEGHEPKVYNGVQGERLKTIKLRKQLSQGLLLPLVILTDQLAGVVSEGDDVTESLGIQKWEAPEKESNAGTATGSKTRPFPYFLRKTDQERIQNIGKLVANTLDEQYEVTVKKDGSSLTVFRVDPDSPYYKDAKKVANAKLSSVKKVVKAILDIFRKPQPVFGICSRNLQLPLEGNTNFHVAGRSVIEAMKQRSGSYAIQGELVAPDIQGNYEKVDRIEFHGFDVFAIDRQEYMLPDARRGLLLAIGVPHATMVDRGTLREILRYQEGDDVVKKLLTYASGPGDHPDVDREGVVFKSEARDFSFKAVSNEYLLATGK